MDQIDSRPEPNETTPYSPQKNSQPLIGWLVFAVIIIGFLVFVLVQGKFASEVVDQVDANSISSSSLDRAISPASIHSFLACQDAGYPVREIYPEECELPDGEVFTRRIEIPDDWVEYSHPESGTSIVYPSYWDGQTEFTIMNPVFTPVNEFELVQKYYNEQYVYSLSKEALVISGYDANPKINKEGELANLKTLSNDNLTGPVYELATGNSACGDSLLVFRANEVIVEFKSPNACSSASADDNDLEYSKVRTELFNVTELITVN